MVHITSHYSYIEICDGRTYVGHVVECCRGQTTEACAVAGAVIGNFLSPDVAATAAYQVAHDQRF